MKSLIISPMYPCFCKELAEYGYDIIPSKKIEEFAEPEQLHADMQALRINDRLFTLKTYCSTAFLSGIRSTAGLTALMTLCLNSAVRKILNL